MAATLGVLCGSVCLDHRMNENLELLPVLTWANPDAFTSCARLFKVHMFPKDIRYCNNPKLYCIIASLVVNCNLYISAMKTIWKWAMCLIFFFPSGFGWRVCECELQGSAAGHSGGVFLAITLIGCQVSDFLSINLLLCQIYVCQFKLMHISVFSIHLSTLRWRTKNCLFCTINALWPSDVIWQQGSRLTLAQVMACCLMTPSHYLNQCWLMISEVLWHSPDNNLTENT